MPMQWHPINSIFSALHGGQVILYSRNVIIDWDSANYSIMYAHGSVGDCRDTEFSVRTWHTLSSQKLFTTTRDTLGRYDLFHQLELKY